MIDWGKVTKRDSKKISEIVKKAYGFLPSLDPMSTNMDLQACHTHGCKLDLDKLLNADEFNLFHDLGGIARHLDRKTGKLLNCFRPRCAA